MLFFCELAGSKAIDWCNVGFIHLWLFVCVGVRNFWLFLIVFVPISCFKLAFLRKAIMSCKLLNISLKLLSMLNMCQCLFIISFIFDSIELYVNENSIESLRLSLQCFKSNDLSRWLTLSNCFLCITRGLNICAYFLVPDYTGYFF